MSDPDLKRVAEIHRNEGNEETARVFDWAHARIAELEGALKHAVEYELAVMYHEDPTRDDMAKDGRTPRWYVNAVKVLGGGR